MSLNKLLINKRALIQELLEDFLGRVSRVVGILTSLLCHAKYVALPNNLQYEICATCGNY